MNIYQQEFLRKFSKHEYTGQYNEISKQVEPCADMSSTHIIFRAKD